MVGAKDHGLRSKQGSWPSTGGRNEKPTKGSCFLCRGARRRVETSYRQNGATVSSTRKNEPPKKKKKNLYKKGRKLCNVDWVLKVRGTNLHIKGVNYEKTRTGVGFWAPKNFEAARGKRLSLCFRRRKERDTARGV